MSEQKGELRQEVKEGVNEIRDDFGRAREEINRAISLALAEIRHHDKQRHTDYHAINEKIDYFLWKLINAWRGLTYPRPQKWKT